MSYLHAHRLHKSAKFSQKLLTAIKADQIHPFPESGETDSLEMQKAEYSELADYLREGDKSSLPFYRVFEEHPSGVLDALNLARILFDERDYVNCASILKIYCI